MLESVIRNQYQRFFVNRIATKIGNYVSPSQITFLGGMAGIAVPFALATQQTYLAIILLLLSGYCDTLDGTIARLKNKISEFGSALDIVMDRCVEFSTLFGLWLVAPNERSFWCILMLGSILICVTSFLVVGIFVQNNSAKSFHYSPGLMERLEAFIFFILMILLPNQFSYLAGLFTLLIVITTINRLFEFALATKK